MNDYRVSNHCKVIRIEQDKVILWSALRTRAIFLEPPLVEIVSKMRGGISLPEFRQLFGVNESSELSTLIQQMIEQKMLVHDREDEEKLKGLRLSIASLPVSVMYLILSRACNLRCSYCYLAEAVTSKIVPGKLMTSEMVKRSVDMMRVVTGGNKTQAEFVLYGGEPLLNPKGVMTFLEYAREEIPDCKITLNTNGTLITEEIAVALKRQQVNVAISIDGPKVVHDSVRRDSNGAGSFESAIRGLTLLKRNGVPVIVSCTITPTNMGCLEETVVWFIESLGVNGLDLNLMLGSFKTNQERSDYQKRASETLIRCYKTARQKGIGIEKVMKIIRPFAQGYASFNSCAGCGQQIVTTPDGMMGVCQGNLNDMRDFIPFGYPKDPTNHPLWVEWRNRSPFNIPTCINCEALAICGGGCPYSARLEKGKIESLDSVHCTFAKATLKFLLEEVRRIKASKSPAIG